MLTGAQTLLSEVNLSNIKLFKIFLLCHKKINCQQFLCQFLISELFCWKGVPNDVEAIIDSYILHKNRQKVTGLSIQQIPLLQRITTGI